MFQGHESFSKHYIYYFITKPQMFKENWTELELALFSAEPANNSNSNMIHCLAQSQAWWLRRESCSGGETQKAGKVSGMVMEMERAWHLSGFKPGKRSFLIWLCISFSLCFVFFCASALRSSYKAKKPQCKLEILCRLTVVSYKKNDKETHCWLRSRGHLMNKEIASAIKANARAASRKFSTEELD